MDRTPTGAARRRVRITDAETERRMLDAALDLIARRGMSVSLEHLSLEEVIATSGVSRSSAYRRWPFKDLFFSDLLVELARTTRLDQEGAGLAERARQQVATVLAALPRQPVGAPPDRHELVVELLRVTVQADFEAVWSSPNRRTHLALNATYLGLPDGELRQEIGRRLVGTERRLSARRARVYAALTDLLGYRLTAPVPGPEGFTLMAEATGSLVTGLMVRALADPDLVTRTRHVAAFGARRPAEWSVPAMVIVGTMLSYLEPDPDRVAEPFDVARLSARIELALQAALEPAADGPAADAS